jgi:integrase
MRRSRKPFRALGSDEGSNPSPSAQPGPSPHNQREPADNQQPRHLRSRTPESADELVPIGLHEARHTFASLMIAAGVNAKRLATYMGHASITVTLDRYGHLFPGNEEESADLLDAFLAKGDAVLPG